jgi:Flp pilus assembly protein TadG
MIARLRPRRPQRPDTGASAVEFALLSVPLFTVLFGAIAYGLYFADVLTVERGTADAARNATLTVGSVTVNWPGTTSCVVNSLGASDLGKVACGLSSSVRPLDGGTVYVKAQIVASGGSPDTWAAGNQLRLCSVAREEAVLPFVPLPNGGLVTSRVDMPIQPGGPPSLTLSSVQMDVSAIGTDWSWC